MALAKDLGGVHKVRGKLDDSRYDSEEKLDTGIAVKDIVLEAREWWEHIGMDMMRGYRFSADCAGKGISANPHSENFIPSGITQGLAWDDLSRDECLLIVKNYHHQKYRKPMREGYGTGPIIF